MDFRLNYFFSDVVLAAGCVISNPATNLPPQDLDLVKVEACISMLEALKSAIGFADEAKDLAGSKDQGDKEWLKEVSESYAKYQVEVAMNLNAIKARVEGIVS
jgi:hypothetical protein